MHEDGTRIAQKLTANGEYRQFCGVPVHRRVAIAFIANNVTMRTLVDHINGKKNDNRVENHTNAAVRGWGFGV